MTELPTVLRKLELSDVLLLRLQCDAELFRRTWWALAIVLIVAIVILWRHN